MTVVAYELLDEQSDFLVLYKKPGISFHSETGEAGLFESLRQACGAASLYPVHRLDKVTSGVLLVAKSAEANRAFCEQFARRTTEKFYVALSASKPSKKQGMVKGDMQPARRGSWKLAHSQLNPAVTQFFSRGLVAGNDVGQGARLFVLRPYTGKTHQLRVALKSLGAPILGDSLYAGASADRTYLHAYSLAFDWQGQRYRYSQLPREGELFMGQDFVSSLGNFAEPWLLPWPSVNVAPKPEAAQ